MTGHSLRCSSISTEDDDERSKLPRSEFVDEDKEEDALFVDAVRLDDSEIVLEEMCSCSLARPSLDLREEELACVTVVEHMIIFYLCICLLCMCCAFAFMRSMMQIKHSKLKLELEERTL